MDGVQVGKITLDGVITDVTKLDQGWYDKYVSGHGEGPLKDGVLPDGDYFKLSVEYQSPFDGSYFIVDKFPVSGEELSRLRSSTPNITKDFFAHKEGVYILASRKGTGADGRFPATLVGVSDNCKGQYIHTTLVQE